MEQYIPALALLALPLFMLYFFKANAGIMLLSACAGLVLLSSLDPAVVTTAGAVVPGEGQAYVRLAVVLLSIVFSGLVFRGTVAGVMIVPNTVIAVLTAAILWITLPEVTGLSWLVESVSNKYWQDVNEFRTLVIAFGFGMSLISVLGGHKKQSKKGKHK